MYVNINQNVYLVQEKILRKGKKVMQLAEYLDKADICVAQFARRLGVTAPTVHNVLKKRDVKAYVAVLIEMETKGKVKCDELVHEKHIIKYLHKKKSNGLL